MPTATSVNVSGTWETAGEVHVNVSGTWRRAIEVYVKNGSTWELVHTDIVLTASSATAYAPVNGLLTPGVTATAAGGGLSYTYLWSRVSGSATPAISSTTATNVSWSIAAPGDYSAVWQCVATDAIFGHTDSIQVSVRFTSTI